MFQFPGFPSYTYGFSAWWQEFFLPGSPIQTSAAQWIFAPPRGFSQLITSFVGSQCQGIRPVPYLAWPFVPTSCSVMMRSVLFLRFLLKSVNLFFSMIYGLMCFWYAVFKVQPADKSNTYQQMISQDSNLLSFPSEQYLNISMLGFYGLKWTRTTDLTLIRRAL